MINKKEQLNLKKKAIYFVHLTNQYKENVLFDYDFFIPYADLVLLFHMSVAYKHRLSSLRLDNIHCYV